MNEEIKARWTARLRSGQDVQGKGFLNKNGKKCCLGVLCELACEAGACGKIVTDTDTSTYGYGGPDGEGYDAEVLPPCVPEWAGLSLFSADPVVLVDGNRTGLSVLNDGDFTFGEIADIIDAQL